MRPAQAQRQVAERSTVWSPPAFSRTLTEFHGLVGDGTQGIGVSTPRAAAVAEATVGFARLVHIPNGRILTIGATSATVAAGCPPIMTRAVGRTCRLDGVIPKLHDSRVPFVRACDNVALLT
jgi:hypothetical protein